MKELDRLVMDEIGLEVDNTYVIDQDYGLVTFNGKTLRYIDDNVTDNIVLDKYDLILNVTDIKISNLLFAYYLDKLHKLEGRYFKLFFPVINKDGSGKIQVISDSEDISSDYFFNEYLRYVDIILKMSGSTVDLHSYDIH